jgi:deoxyribodipyrimidine photo-lyase
VDHVYFGAAEVVRPDAAPYRMFTPYKRRWLERRAVAPRLPLRSQELLHGKLAREETPDPVSIDPQAYGSRRFAGAPRVSEADARDALDRFLEEGGPIERYREQRNFPAADGTSRLSPHLRAGTIGIRTCVESAFARLREAAGEARAGIEAWISELIWREFYQAIYKQFPYVADSPFLHAAQRIRWRNPGTEFTAWCEGRTGYPIVDAAMRQLDGEGWMHNRLRMIAASFLSKHLLIDWRYGALYFEQHLADADPAQNNGGWQWAASTGTDAVPYFRIFNPTAQSKQFDADGTFIKRYVPELRDVPARYIHEPWLAPDLAGNYPMPIVAHESARRRAIAVFSSALRTSAPQ